jgi:hypothetical protein
LPDGTEENHKNFSQNSQFLGQDLYLGPPEHEVVLGYDTVIRNNLGWEFSEHTEK